MRKRLILTTMAAALASLAAIAAPGGAAAATAATCTPATNIEAIIDDSGSMSGTDFNNLRVQAMKLLINKSGNASKTLGAVEFGTDAATVFAPAQIGPNSAAMQAALDTAITSDGGSTDYNDAFTKGAADNPNANARIFLTDGGHNEGTYTNPHVGGPPTYVIGFGSGLSTDDGTRLQQIATDTGGVYYPNIDTTTLQSTVNEIDAILNCSQVPAQFQDQFLAQGQSVKHSTNIGRTTRSIDLVLTWIDPTNVFGGLGFQVVTKKYVYIAKRKKRKKLKVTKTVGTTYTTYHISGVKRGKFKFKVRADTLAMPGATLVTQITQNRTR